MSNLTEQNLIAELTEIIKSRKEDSLRNYASIRERYNTHYDWPEMDSLRHEICLCIIGGVFQAAMTLTNHMLESFLKFALIYQGALLKQQEDIAKKNANDIIHYLPEQVEKYSGRDLSFTINKACSKGIITKTQKENLHKFREAFRNPYSHSDKQKMFGELQIPFQRAHITEMGLQIDPAEIEKLTNLPFTHSIAQIQHSEINAIPYFKYLDEVIRESMQNIFKPSKFVKSKSEKL